MGADRFNEGKLPMHLIPKSTLDAIAEVLQMGAEKYSAHNWRKGLDWDAGVWSSLVRHAVSWHNGEDLDKESGLNHMKHVLVNALFLVHYIENNLGTDDRYKERGDL